MKKEKSLNFLSSKWMMIAFLAFGFVVFSNVNANAQSQFAERISNYEDLRDSFIPGSAKYDIVQDAINYLATLASNSASNPNHLNDLQDQTGVNPLQSIKIRRTHDTILANYTPAQLAGFAGQVDGNANAGNLDGSELQKIAWILDANAY